MASNTLQVLLDNDCLIKAIFQKYFLYCCMALCLMLLVTYYAQIYADTISWSLYLVLAANASLKRGCVTRKQYQ